MKEIEKGHVYSLDAILPKFLEDATKPIEHVLHFVRSTPPTPGPTIQEVLRACIARMQYMQHQLPCEENTEAIEHLREAFTSLELRAIARKLQLVNGSHTPHHNLHDLSLFVRRMRYEDTPIEDLPVCSKCGHIFCEHKGNLYER